MINTTDTYSYQIVKIYPMNMGNSYPLSTIFCDNFNLKQIHDNTLLKSESSTLYICQILIFHQYREKKIRQKLSFFADIFFPVVSAIISKNEKNYFQKMLYIITFSSFVLKGEVIYKSERNICFILCKTCLTKLWEAKGVFT